MIKKQEATLNLISDKHTLHGMPHGVATLRVEKRDDGNFVLNLMVYSESGQLVRQEFVDVYVSQLLMNEDGRRRS